MKYYLAVVQNAEEQDEARFLYDYTDENDAYALFHNERAVRGETRKSTMCKIFTDTGITIAEELYYRTEGTPSDVYYVFIAQNQGEAGEADAVYKRSSYEDALALFHSELGYRHEARNSTIVSILTADGNSVRDGAYRK